MEREFIIAHDWRDEPIYNTDGEHYYNTEHGYVMDDLFETRDYLRWLYGSPQQVDDGYEYEGLF